MNGRIKITENGKGCVDGSHQDQYPRFDVVCFLLKLFLCFCKILSIGFSGFAGRSIFGTFPDEYCGNRPACDNSLNTSDGIRTLSQFHTIYEAMYMDCGERD